LDVCIVASEADPLAREVASSCARRGYAARILDVASAARLYSISVGDGGAVVEPDIPMLLRLPPPKDARGSFDEAFSESECFAALFAAAALSTRPVINRPQSGSLSGRISQSSALTALRSGDVSVVGEVFASAPPEPGKADAERVWCIQELTTFQTRLWPSSPNGRGPFRAKWLDAHLAYEMVVVLDQDAWRSTAVDLRGLELEERSVDLVSSLDLRFAVVTWAISRSHSSAEFVRIDPYPSLTQVRGVWGNLGPALLQALFP
jgi:hypothetical protein